MAMFFAVRMVSFFSFLFFFSFTNTMSISITVSARRSLATPISVANTPRSTVTVGVCEMFLLLRTPRVPCVRLNFMEFYVCFLPSAPCECMAYSAAAVFQFPVIFVLPVNLGGLVHAFYCFLIMPSFDLGRFLPTCVLLTVLYAVSIQHCVTWPHFSTRCRKLCAIPIRYHIVFGCLTANQSTIIGLSR